MRHLIFLTIFIVGCGSKSAPNQDVCSEYPSAYQVQYPDGVYKSNVSVCSGYYKARSVDGRRSTQGTILVVQLIDQSGNKYLTDFTGQ